MENVRELSTKKGDIFAIVGPTGSGKSNLISNIEQLAQGDTLREKDSNKWRDTLRIY